MMGFMLTVVLGICVAGISAQGCGSGTGGPHSECFCVYGKDFNIGDGSAQLRNLFDQVLTPPLQPRDEKYLLGENLDITDPCRFQLEVTMKPGPNGVPKLANAIFRFGIHPTSSNPQRFPRNVKLGGNGVFGKMRGSDIDGYIPLSPFPFVYNDGITQLQITNNGDFFHLFSGQCRWMMKYFLGEDEYLRFFEDLGIAEGFAGACYEYV